MTPPALADLPAPPPGRVGWPWTLAPEPAAGPGPSILIVTPSLQQGAFLEEAIRSVLLQGYPDLAYVVMDGGSRDASVAILEKYAPWLRHWQSAPDSGQADAIARGFDRADGELLAWLNADDRYEPGALGRVAAAYSRRPGAIVAGAVAHRDESARLTHVVRQRGLTRPELVRYWHGRSTFQQPGLFFPRALYKRIGGLSADLDLSFDLDLLLRLLAAGPPVEILDEPVAAFRHHAASKSQARRTAHVLETARVALRHWPGSTPAERAGHLRFVRRALLGAARHEWSRGALAPAIRAVALALHPGLGGRLAHLDEQQDLREQQAAHREQP